MLISWSGRGHSTHVVTFEVEVEGTEKYLPFIRRILNILLIRKKLRKFQNRNTTKHDHNSSNNNRHSRDEIWKNNWKYKVVNSLHLFIGRNRNFYSNFNEYLNSTRAFPHFLGYEREQLLKWIWIFIAFNYKGLASTELPKFHFREIVVPTWNCSKSGLSLHN